MEMGHHLPVIQLISFLEYTHISSEQVLTEYCTNLHEEQLLVASHPLSKADHSASVMLSLAIVLARKDVEVHLHAPQTKTEHFWLCVCVGKL